MPHDTEPCVRGCEHSDGSPARADVGRLCGRCWARLRDHLVMAGPAAYALADGIMPGLRAADLGERVQTSTDPRLPFSAAHRDALDDLHGVIAGWVDAGVEKLGVRGPAGSHERIRAGAQETGLRATLTPEEARAEVHTLAWWAIGHLDMLAYLDLVAPMHDEVVDQVRKARSIAGLVDPLTKRARRACIVCLTGNVEIVWCDDGTVRSRCAHCHLETPQFDPSLVLTEGTS